MKRQAWMLIALVIVFMAADRVVSLGLHHLFYNSQFRFARLYDGGMDNDVVILGNSRGKAYYVPYMNEKLGVQCFNLSYDAIDAELSSLLFADYLDHNAAPKMVIVELNCLLGSTDTHEGSVKVFFSESERFRRFFAENERVKWWLCEAVHVYRYNSDFFLRALSTRNSDQGWVNGSTITQAILDEIANGHRLGDQAPPPERFASLKEILDIAAESGIEVRLVNNPFYPAYTEGSAFIPYEKLARELTGFDVKVWDYRDAFTDQHLFADGRHINVEGSKVLIDLQVADGFYAPVLQ